MREGCCGNAGSKNGLYESPSVPSDKVPILITNESVIPRAMLDKCKNLENLHRIQSTAEGGVNLNNDLFPTPSIEDMTCCGGTTNTLEHGFDSDITKLKNYVPGVGLVWGPDIPAQIPVKLSKGAKMPTKAHDTDAGWDLYANGYFQIPPLSRGLIATGVHFAIPKNHVGLIWPRSGLAVKHGVQVLAGVIDAGYRGEVLVCLYNSDPKEYLNFYQGNKIAQILFQEVSQFELVAVSDLDNTERNTGGFGSSGA